MSEEHDKMLLIERNKKLRNLILKNFSPDQYEIEFHEVRGVISVSHVGPGVTSRRTPRVEIRPTENFLTDDYNNFDQISEQAVVLASNLLLNPCFPSKSLQGEIVISNSGPSFGEINF